jgi:hypothetical protein
VAPWAWRRQELFWTPQKTKNKICFIGNLNQSEYSTSLVVERKMFACCGRLNADDPVLAFSIARYYAKHHNISKATLTSISLSGIIN